MGKIRKRKVGNVDIGNGIYSRTRKRSNSRGISIAKPQE